MRVVIVLKSDTLRSPVTENSGSFQFGVTQDGLAEEVFYQGIMWVGARSHEKSWDAFCSKVIPTNFPGPDLHFDHDKTKCRAGY